MTVRIWVRNLSAIMILVVIGGLGVLAFDRVRNQPRASTLETDENGIISGVESFYNGLEYVESIEGKVAFVLKSRRTLGLDSGWHEIEGVRLELHDRGEGGLVITCDKARFNKQTREAIMGGGVHVAFPDGGFLDTQSGRFDSAGRQFIAESTVVFVGNDTTGTAGSAVYHFPENSLVLQNNVMVKGPRGGALQAPEIVYQGSKGVVTLPLGGSIVLELGTIEARSIRVELAEISGPPEKVVLGGGVRFRGAPAEDLGRIEGWTENLVVKRDVADNWQVSAMSSTSRIRLEMTGGESFFQRSLTTWFLQAAAGPEGILNIRVDQSVCLSEIPVEAAPRRAEAKAARIWFENGQATDIELLKNVIMTGDGLEARGYRARVSGTSNMVMLHSDPSSPDRALLISGQGRIQCDQAHLFEEEGRAQARGNVQGEVRDAVLLAAEEDDAEQPLHFAAGVLDVTGNGANLHLRENARAWQGRRLLLADEIVYRQDVETMRAVGHVRTTFPATQMDSQAESVEDIAVVARSLDYSRSARQAVFLGNVRYHDPEHTMSASELKIFFDENDEITNVEALGSIEIRDLVTGQFVTGQQARREVASKIVVLTGSPAQATDSKGNVVRGDSLTWDQASGNVTVAGDTETIFYPEEPIEPENS